MTEPTFLSRDIDYLGELGAHLRGLTGYRSLAHELIQNADDVDGADEMIFDVRSDALVVDNNGVFSECDDVTTDECQWKTAGGRRCDFHRFRRIAAGDKRGEAGTTGAFGIGFISVYQITDHPELVSMGRHWRLHEDQPPANRIEVCPGCTTCKSESLPGTRFVLPWASDPNSVLRTRLQVAEVKPEAPGLLLDELLQVLSGAMLFLKRLKTLSVRNNGDLLRKFERIDVGPSIILSDGDRAHDTVWHFLTGDFSAKAETLRSAHPGRIEAKRTGNVTLTIDSSLASRGLLWACLPTEHGLGLPFHVNADFFPTVDRKRILFDQDYQAQWNRLAIEGAANILAENVEDLTRLLGPVHFWKLVKSVKAAVDDQTAGEEARVFWNALASRLRLAPTVFTTRGEWTPPEDTYLLQSADEANAIEVLNDLGIELVHEDLRPFQSLIRETLAVPILEVSHVGGALADAGFTQRRTVSEADIPERLRSDQGWEALWNELALLLGRRQSQARARIADEEILRPLAIAPARDGSFWPCRDVSDADELTIGLFGRVGVDVAFISNKAAFSPLRHLCSRFDVSAATTVLNGRESTLEECWHKDPNLVTELFAWLEDRRSAIVPNEALKGQIGRLRIFPSAGSLRTMDEIALPGGFDDPIGLTDLVDVSALGGRREFLSDLGMKALDLNTYVTDRVPSKLRSAAIAPEKLRKLLVLLSTHLGEFRGNTKARQALSEASLLEGTDGTFHAPSSSYFDTTTVRECLANRYPITRLPTGDVSAVRDLLTWLGVESVPRLRDLCTVIRSTVGTVFTDETAGVVRALFAHLATRVKVGDTPTELDPLRRLAWLPARGRKDRWYAPAELYASYQAYLFESEGTFLDVLPAVQNSARPLVEFLGVHATPETRLVVRHLLNSVERGTAVNREVYRVLNEQASDPSILLLRDKHCLWIEGAYHSPREVFWQPHPFGLYRTRLGQEFAVYRALLDKLDVQESPSAADAVAVILSISNKFGATNSALDDNAHDVVMASWQFLERAFDNETDEPPPELAALAGTKCIPNADKLLMPPGWMFFENRAGMAAKFDGFLAANVIPRPIGSSRAMASAGVLSLGSAVQLEVLDLVEAGDDPQTSDRLVTRRQSIARVLEAQSSGRSLMGALARLDELVCQQAKSVRIRYRLHAFGRDVESRPEFVPALFNPRTLTLTVVTGTGKISWAAVARELAIALLPEEDPGRFAAGLKEVLAADDEGEARVALDELGFARLQTESATPEEPVEAVGTLGEDAPPPEEFTDSPFDDPPGAAPPPMGTDALPSDADENTPVTTTPLGEGTGDGGRGQRHQAHRQRRKGKQRQEIWRSYVVPADPNAPPSDHGDDDQLQRSATDEAGIARVLDFERQSGRIPKEMPHTNPGYDVESRDNEGVVVRYIEVKSLSGPWNGTFAVLSRTQFDKADALDDEFWLYVVERAGGDDFRIHRIPNPAANATRFMFDDGWRALGEAPEYPEPPEMV